ncbi:MAG: hypothetical protein SGPRY_004270, partial [Prymnesium sp.]
ASPAPLDSSRFSARSQIGRELHFSRAGLTRLPYRSTPRGARRLASSLEWALWRWQTRTASLYTAEWAHSSSRFRQFRRNAQLCRARRGRPIECGGGGGGRATPRSRGGRRLGSSLLWAMHCWKIETASTQAAHWAFTRAGFQRFRRALWRSRDAGRRGGLFRYGEATLTETGRAECLLIRHGEARALLRWHRQVQRMLRSRDLLRSAVRSLSGRSLLCSIAYWQMKTRSSLCARRAGEHSCWHACGKALRLWAEWLTSRASLVALPAPKIALIALRRPFLRVVLYYSLRSTSRAVSCRTVHLCEARAWHCWRHWCLRRALQMSAATRWSAQLVLRRLELWRDRACSRALVHLVIKRSRHHPCGKALGAWQSWASSRFHAAARRRHEAAMMQTVLLRRPYERMLRTCRLTATTSAASSRLMRRREARAWQRWCRKRRDASLSRAQLALYQSAALRCRARLLSSGLSSWRDRSGRMRFLFHAAERWRQLACDKALSMWTSWLRSRRRNSASACHDVAMVHVESLRRSLERMVLASRLSSRKVRVFSLLLRSSLTRAVRQWQHRAQLASFRRAVMQSALKYWSWQSLVWSVELWRASTSNKLLLHTASKRSRSSMALARWRSVACVASRRRALLQLAVRPLRARLLSKSLAPWRARTYSKLVLRQAEEQSRRHAVEVALRILFSWLVSRREALAFIRRVVTLVHFELFRMSFMRMVMVCRAKARTSTAFLLHFHRCNEWLFNRLRAERHQEARRRALVQVASIHWLRHVLSGSLSLWRSWSRRVRSLLSTVEPWREHLCVMALHAWTFWLAARRAALVSRGRRMKMARLVVLRRSFGRLASAVQVDASSSAVSSRLLHRSGARALSCWRCSMQRATRTRELRQLVTITDVEFDIVARSIPHQDILGSRIGPMARACIQQGPKQVDFLGVITSRRFGVTKTSHGDRSPYLFASLD